MEAWHKHEPFTILASIVSAALFVSVLWPYQNPLWLVLWWLLKTLFLSTYLLLVTRKRAKTIPPQEVVYWEKRLKYSVMLMGLFWGLPGIIFFDANNVLSVLFITFVLMGINGGLGTPLSTCQSAYPPFAIISFAPLTISCFLAESHVFFTMGLLLIIYTSVIVFFSKNSHQLMRSSVELRFANIALIEQLKDEKERVEIADRAKTSFLAAASHDLRQPIHALGMFASTLVALSEQSDLSTPKKIGLVQTVSKKIQASLRGLSGLLDALLDISKLDAGVVAVNISRVPLQPLFDQIKQEFVSAAQQKNIQLHFCATPAVVASDPVLLRQILSNLLSNAIRYTQQGSVMVCCRRHWSNNNFVIEVRDSGIGISRNEQDSVFNEFVQLHNPQRDREQGLGLGLSIVKRTCALLGHRVAIKSQLGRGSVFAVGLPPVRDSNSDGVANENTLLEIPEMLPNVNQHFVLIIDDDQDVREATRFLVESWGFQVICADSGLSAISQISPQQNLICIISDYRLADEKNGADAIRSIVNFCQRPILGVLITGDTSPARIREANASGYEVLHKPVAADVLQNIVLAAFNRTPKASTQ